MVDQKGGGDDDYGKPPVSEGKPSATDWDAVIRLEDARRMRDMYAAYAAGRGLADPRQADLFGVPKPATPQGPAAWFEEGDWDEAAIPTRPWIARGYLLRRTVTMIAGPPSAGKSTLMNGYACALALGLPYGGMRPLASMRVLTYNVEDDGDEQRRRLSATLRQFNRLPADIAGRVIRVGPAASGLLLTRDPITGGLLFTPAMMLLELEIISKKPDVVILDPMVELHDADENDNNAVRAIMARLRSIAVEHDLAVVVLHHSRKGSAGSAGDPETMRGASSIIGAARVVLTTMQMTADEAKALGIEPDERGRYFRVDSAKSNYTALQAAEWFERREYTLANGDGSAAAVPWTPPSAFFGITAGDCNLALDRIASGPEPGVLYTGHRSCKGGGPRWAGRVLVDDFGKSEGPAAEIIRQWLKTGLLYDVKYHDAVQRRERSGLAVNASKRPT